MEQCLPGLSRCLNDVKAIPSQLCQLLLRTLQMHVVLNGYCKAFLRPLSLQMRHVRLARGSNHIVYLVMKNSSRATAAVQAVWRSVEGLQRDLHTWPLHSVPCIEYMRDWFCSQERHDSVDLCCCNAGTRAVSAGTGFGLHIA